MEQQITVEQAVQATINILSSINVPAGLIEQIGIPISRSISNLRHCMGALEQMRQARELEPVIEPEAGEGA